MKRTHPPPEVVVISSSDEESEVVAVEPPATKRKPNPLTVLMTNRRVMEAAKVGLEGVYQFKNFVTKEEAVGLLGMFEKWGRWKKSGVGAYDVMNFGVVTVYGKRQAREPDLAKGEKDVPEFLTPLIDRVCEKGQPWSAVLGTWRPNEGNINAYDKTRGDWLRDHYDDRYLSGPVIAVLTLTGSTAITYKTFPKGTPQSTIDKGLVTPLTSTKIFSPSLGLQLLTGPARYNYTHGIATEDLSDERRVCIVLRQTKITI